MCVNSSLEISENLKDFQDSKSYIYTFGVDYFVCVPQYKTLLFVQL